MYANDQLRMSYSLIAASHTAGSTASLRMHTGPHARPWGVCIDAPPLQLAGEHHVRRGGGGGSVLPSEVAGVSWLGE